MEEHIFVDWNQNNAVGEPRNVNISFSDYISSIEVTNAGYGYSVPVEVKQLRVSNRGYHSATCCEYEYLL